MSAKHTPGPWHVSKAKIRSGDTMVLGGDGPDFGCVATVTVPIDAHLIAAAPNVLMAGKHLALKLVELYRAAGANPVECQAVRDWMVAAEKAEGRP